MNKSSISPTAWVHEKSASIYNICADLERENAALRNEIARLNGQTIWMCACGGTDCEGREENAALREGIALAVKWAELGLVDYLPEYAVRGFLNDWKKLEQLLGRET